MPYPFTGPKKFWAGPNVLCQTKDYFSYFARPKLFVPEQTDDLHLVNLFSVCADTKSFGAALNTIQFLV